jgi:ribose 1,5-bisphosphokinase
LTTGGTLVLVVGPSGVGKDSLIAYCRQRLAIESRVIFPTRVITRPAADPCENHIAVTIEEFRRRVAAGGFALHWHAHGLGYGIPVAIENDLAADRCVVVNVSRAVVDEARHRYRRIIVASVTASRDVLAARLLRRGRDSEPRNRQRLERADRFRICGKDVVDIDNSGDLECAGKTLLTILIGLSPRAPAAADAVNRAAGTPVRPVRSARSVDKKK